MGQEVFEFVVMVVVVDVPLEVLEDASEAVDNA
jgi:hypothetical protein